MRLRDDAARVYLVMQSTYGFCFTLIVTVNLIYQAATVGLTAFQLVLVGSVLELVCVLCEVPTGALADLVGRRPAIVAGIALIGAGFTLEGLVPELGAILAGNVLFGVGATLTSGAEQAWLTDEVGETAAAGLFLTGARLENGATLAAIPVAVLIAQRTITTPIVLGGLGLVALAVLLAAVMPETRRPVGEGRGLAAGMRAQVAESLAVVRTTGLVRRLTIVAVVAGAFSEGVDRLSTAHFLRDVGTPAAGGFEPVVWLGGLFAIQAALSIVVLGRLSGRIERRGAAGAPSALAWVYVVMSLSTALFAVSRRFGVAAACSLTGGSARQLEGPLILIGLNPNLRSETRATVISMVSQANAAGQIAGGLAIGVVASAASIEWALLLAAAILLAAPFILLRGRRAEERCRAPGDCPTPS